MALNMAWYDWVGIAGALLVLLAFWLSQTQRLSGSGIVYQLLNLCGAGGLLVSLLGDFNAPAFLLEAAWLLISGYGIVRWLRVRRASQPR